MHSIVNDSLVRAAVVGGIGGSVFSVFGRTSFALRKIVSTIADLAIVYFLGGQPFDQCLLLGCKAVILSLRCDGRRSAFGESSRALLKGMTVVILGQIALNILSLRRS